MMRSLRCSAGLRRASWHSRLRNTRTLRLKAFFDIKFDVSSDAFPECFHFMEAELVEQLIFQRSADFIQRRELSLLPFIVGGEGVILLHAQFDHNVMQDLASDEVLRLRVYIDALQHLLPPSPICNPCITHPSTHPPHHPPPPT